MLVKDIILKACELLEEKDLCEAIKIGEIQEDEQIEKLEMFVNCFNLVRNEIASEVMPNVVVETISTKSGKIEFSSLKHKVIDVLAVKDVFGNSVAFDIFNDHIVTNLAQAEVKYNASPEELTLHDEFASTIPERVFAYGIVREYYYIQTLYEDAKIWDERFLNSLQSLERKKGETIIPRRRWM